MLSTKIYAIASSQITIFLMDPKMLPLDLNEIKLKYFKELSSFIDT